MKQSRMEMRLQAEIASSTDSIECILKRLDLGVYWARSGRFVEARGTLSSIRQKNQRQPDIRVSSALHLLDGLIDHFTDMRDSAREKILRAYALAGAAGLRSTVALSAAWLAQLSYLQLRPKSMIIFLQKALEFSTETDHSARSRAALVVAQSYHYAGDSDKAKPWYKMAHWHASKEMDDSAVSALMHNMAWLRFNELRSRRFSIQPSNAKIKYDTIEADSIHNYDALIGVTSFSSFVPILRAQILTAAGLCAEALEIFENDLSIALGQGMARLESDWMADQAWCRLNVGQITQATADTEEACLALGGAIFDDDLAYSHIRLSEIFNFLQDFAAADDHRRIAYIAWTRHLSVRRSVLVALSELKYP